MAPASTSTAAAERIDHSEPISGRLGDLLLQEDLISRAQLAEALLQQAAEGKLLGQLLVDLGALEEAALIKVLSLQLELPVADLRQQKPSPEVVELLSETLARAIVAVPLAADGADGAVDVVVAEPTEHVRAQLKEAIGRDVRLLIAPRAQVQQAIDSSYRALAAIGRHVKAFESSEALRPKTALAAMGEATTDDAPVVQVVNLVMTQALRDRASDVHIEPQDDALRVRFRIDGALHDAIDLPPSIGPALISRLKIMAGMNIVERRRAQDGQLTMTVDDREIDVRVATVATIWGEKCVLRLLDRSRSLLRLANLGMPPDTHNVFSKMVKAPFGMMLCAGPTGSGKTTTLYATLSEINEPHRNIMTIEDPVEYVLPSINQIQTNDAADMTFAGGLKSILRQDPDVILVGEIRDVETARIAVQSALTGHFVLSSLHATDSVAALHRFLDMGIESFLVASSVVGIVGQRLMRRMCTSCQVPYKPTDEEMAFHAEAGGSPKKTFLRGEGCTFCADTGYRDRIGIYELLRITPEIKRLVVGWATQEELRRMAVSQGMRTLQEEAIALVDNDVTTLSEVIRSLYAF